MAPLLSVELFAGERLAGGAPLSEPEDDTACFFLLFPLLLDFFPIVDAQILFNVQGEEVYIMYCLCILCIVWGYWKIRLKVSKHQSNDLISCGGKCQIFFCFLEREVSITMSKCLQEVQEDITIKQHNTSYKFVLRTCWE